MGRKKGDGNQKLRDDDDDETDDDDDESPPTKPTAIPENWKSHCLKDLHWCKHFFLDLVVNNMVDSVIPGIDFVPPTMPPSMKEDIEAKCKKDKKCIWKKTKKWDEENVLPELLKAALAGGENGGESSDDYFPTGHSNDDGRGYGQLDQSKLIITIIVSASVVSFLLLVLLIYCCCCCGGGKRKSSPSVHINNVAVRSSKKSKRRPKSSTKRRLSHKSRSAKKLSRKSQRSSQKKPTRLEIHVQ